MGGLSLHGEAGGPQASFWGTAWGPARQASEHRGSAGRSRPALCPQAAAPHLRRGHAGPHNTPRPAAPPVTAEGRRGGGRDPFPFPFSAVAVAPSCTKVCSTVSVQGQAGPEPWPLSSGSPRGPLQGDGGMSSGRRLCNFSVFLRHQRASIMWA